MAKCMKCGKSVGCGCRLKTAPDGKRVCLSCYSEQTKANPTASATIKFTRKK